MTDCQSLQLAVLNNQLEEAFRTQEWERISFLADQLQCRIDHALKVTAPISQSLYLLIIQSNNLVVRCKATRSIVHTFRSALSGSVTDLDDAFDDQDDSIQMDQGLSDTVSFAQHREWNRHVSGPPPLRHWFLSHLDNPYPTPDERTLLAETLEISLHSVDSHLTNWRRRGGWSKIKDKWGQGTKKGMAELITRFNLGEEFRPPVVTAIKKMINYFNIEKVGDWMKEIQPLTAFLFDEESEFVSGTPVWQDSRSRSHGSPINRSASASSSISYSSTESCDSSRSIVLSSSAKRLEVDHEASVLRQRLPSQYRHTSNLHIWSSKLENMTLATISSPPTEQDVRSKELSLLFDVDSSIFTDAFSVTSLTSNSNSLLALSPSSTTPKFDPYLPINFARFPQGYGPSDPHPRDTGPSQFLPTSYLFEFDTVQLNSAEKEAPISLRTRTHYGLHKEVLRDFNHLSSRTAYLKSTRAGCQPSFSTFSAFRN